MNKFISKFVATAVLSAVTITAVNAGTTAVWNAADSGLSTTDKLNEGGDLVGKDINVTLTLNSDMNPGTTFDFHVLNGSIKDSGSFLLCNGEDVVGKYVNLVAGANGRATVIGLEFSTDANTSKTKAGQVLQLIDSSGDRNCSSILLNNTLNIRPDLGKCPSVFSDNGRNNNDTRDVTEINTQPVKVLTYKPDIMIACDTPICGITLDGKGFTTTSKASGVNKRVSTDVGYDNNATSTKCYEGLGCDSVDGTTTCTTYISIQNNTDQNISKVKLALTGTIPSGMYATFSQLDNNGTEQNVTLNGGTIDIDNISIYGGAGSSDNNSTLKIVFTSDGTSTISETMIGGSLTLDTNNSTSVLNGTVLPTNGIAKFSTGATTDFTVTYMNPSFKTFAMITAQADSKLSATITDSTGKTAEATTFPDMTAGTTTFVWADKAGHATSPLQVAADAAGLNNAWRVDFHVTAAVDVAAYMEANGGQRTLTVLYPEYTHDLTNP